LGRGEADHQVLRTGSNSASRGDRPATVDKLDRTGKKMEASQRLKKNGLQSKDYQARFNIQPMVSSQKGAPAMATHFVVRVSSQRPSNTKRWN
jgi:membrane carboxypeptidase/penicillin-binding protein PbpC